MRKFIKLNEKQKKLLVIFLALAVFVTLGVIVLRLYLNIQLILGHDVLIDLTVDREHVRINNSEEAEFIFTTSVRTNPFCSASCNYTFRDMSTLENLETSDSMITLIEPLESSFNLTADKGRGSKMYRYEISCSSERTFFCRTREHETSRHLSVILEHDLNPSQEQAKNSSNEYIKGFAEDISGAYSDVLSFNRSIEDASHAFIVDNRTDDLLAELAHSDDILTQYTELWSEEEYENLWGEIQDLHDSAYAPIWESEELLQSLEQDVISFNEALENLTQAKERAEEFNQFMVWDEDALSEAMKALTSLNSSIKALQRPGDLQEMLDNATSAIRNLENVSMMLEEKSSKHMDNFTENYNNITGTLCGMVNCTEADIDPVNAPDDATEACDVIDMMWNASADLDESQREELSLLIPEPCLSIDTHLEEMDREPLMIRDALYEKEFHIPDNPVMCCTDGHCKPCCKDDGCAKTPVIFIHGHALDRDSSPDFNMDTFNDLQAMLEDYGIVNMGRISLYRYFELPPNLWGRFSKPISLKASYYYDVYTEDDSSIIVPTKNDNLDTYAVRLDDIIGSVLHKTGAENVSIIAHSMGGLVVRRYMQIFGTERVDRVLTSGSPHHGITGWVSTMCPVFGERLECRDMREGSLFLNKLNREPLPDVPFYNVVAVGCEMDGRDSDGVVLKESALLEGAENIIIEGHCRGSAVLHSTFVRDLHPGYREAVLDFLELD